MFFVVGTINLVLLAVLGLLTVQIRGFVREAENNSSEKKEKILHPLLDFDQIRSIPSLRDIEILLLAIALLLILYFVSIVEHVEGRILAETYAHWWILLEVIGITIFCHALLKYTRHMVEPDQDEWRRAYEATHDFRYFRYASGALIVAVAIYFFWAFPLLSFGPEQGANGPTDTLLSSTVQNNSTLPGSASGAAGREESLEGGHGFDHRESAGGLLAAGPNHLQATRPHSRGRLEVLGHIVDYRRVLRSHPRNPESAFPVVGPVLLGLRVLQAEDPVKRLPDSPTNHGALPIRGRGVRGDEEAEAVLAQAPQARAHIGVQRVDPRHHTPFQFPRVSIRIARQRYLSAFEQESDVSALHLPHGLHPCVALPPVGGQRVEPPTLGLVPVPSLVVNREPVVQRHTLVPFVKYLGLSRSIRGHHDGRIDENSVQIQKNGGHERGEGMGV